jgi:hypothetical protein
VLFKHLSIHISEFLNGSRVDIADDRKLEITKIEVVPSGMFVTSYFADLKESQPQIDVWK